jgi:hypothetical protein
LGGATDKHGRRFVGVEGCPAVATDRIILFVGTVAPHSSNNAAGREERT